MSCISGLYRSICGFVVPDLTNTDNFRITSHGRTKSCSKADNVTTYFSLVWWKQIAFAAKDVFNWIFVCHDFTVGEVIHDITVQRCAQRGFPGAGFATDKPQTVLTDHRCKEIRFNIHGPDIRYCCRYYPHCYRYGLFFRPGCSLYEMGA